MPNFVHILGWHLTRKDCQERKRICVFFCLPKAIPKLKEIFMVLRQTVFSDLLVILALSVLFVVPDSIRAMKTNQPYTHTSVSSDLWAKFWPGSSVSSNGNCTTRETWGAFLSSAIES